MKRILVIGGTSAIAAACARRWATQKAEFFLVGRTPQKLDQVASDLAARGAVVYTHVLDLNQFDGHSAMLSACYAALGHVDVALIAHGTLPDQRACEQNAQEAAKEFSNNGLSVIVLLGELANRMEAQKSGCIAVISSVAGDRGRYSNYLYGSAKAAVSAFCDGLRARLFHAGVHVLVIKPGFVDTPMTKGLSLPQPLVTSAEQVARTITDAIERGADSIYTPVFWAPIMFVIRHIPTFLFKRLKL